MAYHGYTMRIAIKKKELAGLLPAGDHLVTITSAIVKHSKENDVWKGTSRQLEIVCRNESGMTTAWINMDGYKNKSDFGDGIAPKGHEFRSFDENSELFLVDKTSGKRVISQERTDKLSEQIGNLAFCAGFTPDEDAEDGKIEMDEITAGLIYQEVGVRIKENNKGKTEVFHFVPSDEVAVVEEVEEID